MSAQNLTGWEILLYTFVMGVGVWAIFWLTYWLSKWLDSGPPGD